MNYSFTTPVGRCTCIVNDKDGTIGVYEHSRELLSTMYDYFTFYTKRIDDKLYIVICIRLSAIDVTIKNPEFLLTRGW